MGAQTFETLSTGTTAREAFDAAVTQAQYDHGHSGYTGTIAEKLEYTVLGDGEAMTSDDAHERANELLDADDPRIRDKWGPAGAIPVEGGQWLFFGWASC